MAGRGAVESIPEAIEFPQLPTAAQFSAFREEFLSHKKVIQEEVAKLKTAEKLREEFRKERRWWIGITITLVGLALFLLARVLP